MEKFFLVSTTTKNEREIIGSNYLIKAISKEDIENKMNCFQYEHIVNIIDINELTNDFINDSYYPENLKNGVFRINDRIIE